MRTGWRLLVIVLIILHFASGCTEDDTQGNEAKIQSDSCNLIDLYKNGETKSVQDAIARGQSVDNIDSNGMTLLHYAVNKDDTSLVDCLLNHGINSNLQDKDGRTALHLAIKRANMKRVGISNMLIGKTNLNLRDNSGQTVLHYLAKRHFLGAAMEKEWLGLVGKAVTKENVNGKDGRGNTALHIAAYMGHLEICKILIKNGAQVNERNKDGNTALMLAYMEGVDPILGQRSSMLESTKDYIESVGGIR